MSLAASLEAIRVGAKERISEDLLAKMHQATEELRQSGIIDRALNVGEFLPSFLLVNETGEVFNSSEMLAKGPLVVTFYRGVW